MEFRPAPPRPRQAFPLVIFSALLIVVALRAAMHPSAISPLLIAALLGFVAFGAWLVSRLRFPGSPRLRVDRNGLTYTRGGRARALLWSEIAAIHLDHRRKELRFLPATGAPPVVVHSDMIAANGQRFDGIIERWWRAPDPA